MMFKHFEGARLGVFVFLGTALLVVSIFFIGNQNSLFTQSVRVKTYFNNVVGLRNGAPVWLSGYNIGNVESVSIASDTTGRVEVVMRIDKELHHFIRTDSEASIETAGLVGKKIVAITPGSGSQPIVKDGGIIKSKNPLKISAILEDSRDVIRNLSVISKEFAEISERINAGEGTIGMLINDEELYKSTVDLSQEATQSMKGLNEWFTQIRQFTDTLNIGIKSITANIDTAVADIRLVIKDIRNGEGIVGKFISDKSTYESAMKVIDNLIETTEATKVGALRLAENMEALKHNWLFKGYFENRGYWDSSEFSKEIDKKLNELEAQKKLMYQKLHELDQLKKELEVEREKMKKTE